jgi:hypothetical protein
MKRLSQRHSDPRAGGAAAFWFSRTDRNDVRGIRPSIHLGLRCRSLLLSRQSRHSSRAILHRVIEQPNLAGRPGVPWGQGGGVPPAPAEAPSKARVQGCVPGCAQVLVHVLAFDDEGRILLGRAAGGALRADTLWGLPSTPALAGRDPDLSARLLAPAPGQPGTSPPRRPVLLGARSEPSDGPPTHRMHLLYAVHVPVPPPGPRPDGAVWWGLAEAAQLKLSEHTRLALALGWQLLSEG